MAKPVPRPSPGAPRTTGSVSRSGRSRRRGGGVQRTAPAPDANPDPAGPGLRGIHRLANRMLLASLLLSAVLCVLELQVRINIHRTYTALQEARTMQRLYLDSRSQLLAALGAVNGAGTTGQGGDLAGQDPEPLVLPPPPDRPLQRRPLLLDPGRWLPAGPVLRGY